MCEIGSILNALPLTTISNDPRNLDVIAPNHLLLKNTSSPPPDIFKPKDIYSERRWRQVNYLTNVFWSRWRSDYLTLLQKRQKWHTKGRNFTIRDIVMAVDEYLPRNQWGLGRVIETYPDTRGLVRNVKLRTKFSEIMRPITKICLLTPEI